MSASAEDIAALEARRSAAMLAGDAASLEGLLHDDLVYIHSNGAVDTKASYLEAVASGALDYRSISTFGETLIDHGSVIMATGTVRIDVVVDGVEREVSARYTYTYAGDGDSWRFASWQSTSVPA